MRDTSSDEGRGAVAGLLRLLALAWVLCRVAFFVGAGLSLFLIAFLGYFTLPFLFLAVALVVLAAGSGRTLAQRLRRGRTR